MKFNEPDRRFRKIIRFHRYFRPYDRGTTVHAGFQLDQLKRQKRIFLYTYTLAEWPGLASVRFCRVKYFKLNR